MITNICISITNPYAIGVSENFYYPSVDISDKEEMDYCADEACGIYLDMHGDIWNTLSTPFETIAEACEYIIEEVK